MIESTLRKNWGIGKSEQVVRFLMMGEMIALMFSPPLTNLFELLVYVSFFASPILRERLLLAVRQPMAVMSLVLLLLFSVGLIYSVDTLNNSIGYWISWRRLLLVPLAVAAFYEKSHKLQAAWVLVVTLTLCSFLSYVTYVLNVGVYKYPPGIIIRNHATQGMLFSVGAFVSFFLLRFSYWKNPAQHYFLWLGLTATASNIVLINKAGSGYLALLVLVFVSVYVLWQGRPKALAFIAVTAIFAAILAISPVTKEQIKQAVEEVVNYKNARHSTSMGVRMVMLDNTLEMIKKRPWLGYGTGGFGVGYHEQVKGKTGWQAFLTDDPHNQFLKIYAEYGLVGFLIFLLFIVSFFYQKIAEPWCFLGWGVLLAWCATSLFSSHFSTFSEGRFLLLWCAMMLAIEGTGNVDTGDSRQ